MFEAFAERTKIDGASRVLALLAVVLGHQLAACSLYVVESIELWSLDARSFIGAARQAFVIVGAGGTALGTAIAMLEAVRLVIKARAPKLASGGPYYAVLSLAPFYWLGTELFSGEWISRQPFAWAAPPLIAAAGACALWIATWMVAYLASLSLMAAAASLIVVGAAMAFLDRAFPKDSYVYAHGALILLSALALGAACRLLIYRAIPWSPRRAAAALAFSAALACSVPLASAYGPTVAHRLFWDSYPTYSGRLYEGARKAAFVYRLRNADGGTYRDDIALWASDQEGLPSPQDSLKTWKQSVDATRRAAASAERPFTDGLRPHLVLITVDALRADIAYEGTGEGSVRQLDETALVFSRAYSGSSSTRTSLPVLLSGQADWRQQEDNIIGALQGAGYETALVTDFKATQWLKSQDQLWLDRTRAITASGDGEGWSSEEITALAEKFIAERAPGAPVFLWVHYFDLHEWTKLDHSVRGGDMPSSYRRTWSRVQTQISRLVRSAQATLGADEVCFIFASDHGEYLGEMNRTHHTKWVGSEVVRIPLVLIVPGQAAGQVVDPVGAIDVAPTLALLAGVTLPGAEGIPLLSPNAAELVRRPIVMGESLELGVVLGDHRLVLDPSRNFLRLFDDARGGKELSRDAHGELSAEMLELLLGSPVARQSYE